MPRVIPAPTVVPYAGTRPKRIEEFVGRVNTGTAALSIARMTSPPGWVEPGQAPEFDEYTLVLEGSLRVESAVGSVDIGTGQAVHVAAGEWVRYSTPGGATYVSVCLPAFSLDTVHRDE